MSLIKYVINFEGRNSTNVFLVRSNESFGVYISVALFLLQAVAYHRRLLGGVLTRSSQNHCTLWSTDRLRWPQTIWEGKSRMPSSSS